MQWRLREWFPELPEETHQQLHLYASEIEKWNKKLNLISPGTLEECDRIHFADSILGVQSILKTGSTDEIFDIGSGNGFPGLICGILNSQQKVSCVEVDERKCGFLMQMAAKAGLRHIKVMCERVENLESGSISMGISRAFASLSRSNALCGSVFSPGASYFHFKGAKWEQELAEWNLSPKCSTWNISLVSKYEIPRAENSLEISERIILKGIKA